MQILIRHAKIIEVEETFALKSATEVKVVTAQVQPHLYDVSAKHSDAEVATKSHNTLFLIAVIKLNPKTPMTGQTEIGKFRICTRNNSTV